MTKQRLAGVLMLAVVGVAACTRPGTSSSGGGATPDQVYAAGPSVQDVRTTLGSDTWWPGTPSFLIRPLGLPTMSQNTRFEITQHFLHVGTSEQFVADYVVFTSTSTATTQFTAIQNAVTSVTGPKAGDQSIYFGTKSPTDSALFDTSAVVRVGPTLIGVDLTKGQGFTDVNTMGRLANKLVSRLKSATSGHLKPSPVPDSDRALLLPLGLDVTQVAAVRLPIEVAAGLFGATTPQDLVDGFTKLGVKDFLYGDYALNADLNMEVRAVVFTFSSPGDAASLTDQIIGKGNLDASGVASGYSSALGEYVAFILNSNHVGMLFCGALSPNAAASRSCEAPFDRLIGAWQTRLG